MAETGNTDDWASGNAQVDGEHHMQLELLTALGEAVRTGAAQTDVDDIADRLVEFSKVHFASEEMLMRLYSYEHFETHVQDHGRALEGMEALKDTFARAGGAAAGDSVRELSRLIGGHIRSADRMLAEYLHQTNNGTGMPRT